MDLEVVGRHALLFDDDSNASFINTKDALVEWNSLLIDRYDVRHLLQSPPPPIKRRRRSSSPSSSSLEESQLDQERYLDLPPPSDDDDRDQSSGVEKDRAEPTDGRAYNVVGFSYANSDNPIEQKSSDASGFLPPFPVPESLLQSLMLGAGMEFFSPKPPTEKLHQIMARTALFVCKHGGQSEIVLRVKQGDNPTFGFLMPDHHLHAYFRFLVDHPEVLSADADSNSQDKDEKAIREQNEKGDVVGGALSLLGSVYGSGEDEDGAVQVASESKENEPGDSSSTANVTPDHGAASSGYSTGKDEAVPKQIPSLASKEKSLLTKKTHSVNMVSSSTVSGKKRKAETLGLVPVSVDKAQASTLSSAPKVEPLILEPPSDLKRMMEKIVEFILKNGKEFEAVLIEQDSANGRFPFLLPSNHYHPYYLKVLQNAQESKQAGKSFAYRKHDSIGQVSGKKSALTKDPDNTLSKVSGSYDFPRDTEKREKFKMVISAPKKDPQDPPTKPAQQQFGVSVDAAAAILQAATRGLRNPNLDILRQLSLADAGRGLVGDGGPTSSLGSHSFPISKSTVSTPIESSRSGGRDGASDGASDVLVAKDIAETAALAAASEADSSEAGLTREQKQKAERLKRAKMFAAMIKSGVAPRLNEPFPRLSAEPPDSVLSGLVASGSKIEKQDFQAPDASNLSGAEAVDPVTREREGSSVPIDVDTSNKMEKPEKSSDDYFKEHKSRKQRHLRSRKVEEDDDGEDEDEDDEEMDRKHSRKKKSSHHSSSHHSSDKHRHRKRHSSSKDREYMHRKKHHSSSEDEVHERRRRSDKHRSHSERNMDSEAEHSRKSSDLSGTARVGNGGSRDTCVNLLNDRWDGSTPSIDAQPSDSTTEVPSDLRAKVRAMLLATL